jgi:hypothetical protein
MNAQFDLKADALKTCLSADDEARLGELMDRIARNEAPAGSGT